MGKLGDVLAAGGKGMLDGMAQMGGLPGNNLNGKNRGIPGSGVDMAGGPMSGVQLMNALFEQLNMGKKKKTGSTDSGSPSGGGSPLGPVMGQLEGSVFGPGGLGGFIGGVPGPPNFYD